MTLFFFPFFLFVLFLLPFLLLLINFFDFFFAPPPGTACGGCPCAAAAACAAPGPGSGSSDTSFNISTGDVPKSIMGSIVSANLPISSVVESYLFS